jgi:hypothetical protein
VIQVFSNVFSVVPGNTYQLMGSGDFIMNSGGMANVNGVPANSVLSAATTCIKVRESRSQKKNSVCTDLSVIALIGPLRSPTQLRLSACSACASQPLARKSTL